MSEQNSGPESFFKAQTALYETRLQQVKKQIARVATGRIMSFLLTVLGIYLSAGYGPVPVSCIALAGFSVFGFFVFRHVRLFRQKAYTEKLLSINQNELRLFRRDTSQQPTGEAFAVAHHPFAGDLDLFGQGSLFQLLDRCATFLGRRRLAAFLNFPSKTPETIRKRQQAIAELAADPHWRQEFQAAGSGEDTAADSLLQWAVTGKTHFSKPVFLFLLWLTPLLGFADILLISLGILPIGSFFLFLMLPFAVLVPRQAEIQQAFMLLGKKSAQMEQYARLFEKLERKKFNSGIMQDAVKVLAGGEDSAFVAVKKLSDISKAFDYRLNLLVGIFLNVFFLWDIMQSRRLGQWKKRYGNKMDSWFDVLAQTDALCSLAGFAFQHPKAVYPHPVKDRFLLRGQNLKHPFIDPAVCVGNPVNIEGWGYFQVITGANMAGKSTYLRTVGVNFVLAMTGAPVLADEFVFTPVQLFTGIKTSDSLQDGESYFFAELKRLKEIIERLEKGERLFILLDEILRGTNSKDKQKGSQALLKQLIRLGASGMIATHDLSLGALQKEFPENVVNKRFEVEIINNRLQFDYLLKEGISQNLNATFLMKKMGITV